MQIISEIGLIFSVQSLTTLVGMVKRGVSVGRLLRGE